MARMFPRGGPEARGGTPVAAAERQLFDRLARDLGADWSIIHDCAIRAGGGVRVVEFVLIHRELGVALLDDATSWSAASGPAAIAALRAMLDEIGFTRRFRGDIAIVARRLGDASGGDIAGQLFAGCKASTIADPTWPDWLIQRLTPALGAGPAAPARPTPGGSAADSGLRLRAPDRGEAWRVAAAETAAQQRPAMRNDAGGGSGGGSTGALAPDRPIAAVSQAAPTRTTIAAGMGFAALVVAVVLVGMALLSNRNAPPQPATTPATTQ